MSELTDQLQVVFRKTWNWRSCNLPPLWTTSATAAWGFTFCKCKGDQAPEAAPAMCVVLVGVMQTWVILPGRLRWFFFIWSSTLTVTECWRAVHWVQEEEAMSCLCFPEDLFLISQLHTSRETAPSFSAWCTVGPLLFTRKRGNVTPSSPLCQFWHLCEYSIYC